MAWYLRPGLYIGPGVMLERRVYNTIAGTIPAIQYTAQCLCGYRIMRSSSAKMSFNVEASVFSGVEIVNCGRKTLYDGSVIRRTCAGVLGISAGVVFYYHLSRRISIGLTVADRVCVLSPTHINSFTMGIRCNVILT